MYTPLTKEQIKNLNVGDEFMNHTSSFNDYLGTYETDVYECKVTSITSKLNSKNVEVVQIKFTQTYMPSGYVAKRRFSISRNDGKYVAYYSNSRYECHLIKKHE